MTAKRYRLAAINTHPIQVFAPLYRRVAQHPEIDLSVFYCSKWGIEEYVDPGFGRQVKWDVPLLDGYRHRFVPNVRKTDAVTGFLGPLNPSLALEVAKGRFDALWLNGYFSLNNWLAFGAARLTSTPICYFSESSLQYDRLEPRSLVVRVVKPRVLKFWLERVSAYLAIGSRNRDFYLHYGADPSRIFHVPYAVDNDHFRDKATQHRSGRAELRASLGIGVDDVVFMFAAKMIPIKAVMPLLEAYRALGDTGGHALIMAGDGELLPAAKAYASTHGMKTVHFPGFLNQTELPRYFAASDVFMRPDGVCKGDWGLTINEAMASGMAIIATDALGAAEDLVRPGENGLVVRFREQADLIAAMRSLAADPALCRRMGERSTEIIRTWGYEECVEGILQALRRVA
jgi:glycosyltransferase involved in cell wall biosynthesis